jgi:hypothetical protein
MLLAGYSFYAWKKYSDTELFWLGNLGVLVVVLLAAGMFFPEPSSGNVRLILDLLRYCGWIFVLGALAFIEVRKRRK